MNKKVLRIVSVILAISVALPFAACKKSGNRKKITDDTPWFTAEQIDLELGVDDSKKIDYLYSQYAGGDEDYMIVFTTGSYYIDYDNIDWNTYNYNDYAINFVSVIDKETKDTVSSIDLSTMLTENDYANSAVYSGGVITLLASSWDPITYESLTKEIDVDPATGNVLDTRELEAEESSIERTFRVGEYRIDTEYVWGESSNEYYNLYITGPDGDKEKITLQESGTDIWDIAMILALSDTTALVPCSTSDNDLYYELDLTTCKATKVDDEDYEWLNDVEMYSATTGSDGLIYFTDSTGISRLNVEEKSVEQYFNFSWCDVNRSMLSNLSVVDSSEDSFTLCGSYYSNEAFSAGRYSIGEFILIEFNKADSNPHAGKDILELYTPYGYLDEVTADAILEFNEDNGKYFIEVTDRYSEDDYYEDYDTDEINSEDDWQKIDLDATAAMSNDLAMDIMNGEGPDILMNVSSYGQLNDDTYLADLSKYVGELDSGNYFMNIIDGARIDGKLYQVPVTFTIEGIQTDASYAGASGVGFTTEEYEDFLNNTLNGDDVIPSGQALYFAKLFTNMSEKFIVNGKVDFSGPEFEELAEFVKDNVREAAKTYEEMYPEDDYYYGMGGMEDAQVAAYTVCYGFSTYFYNSSEFQGASTILGLPSADGRGPLFSPGISVAVSSQAYDIDACGEFVKLLLGDNVQRKLGLQDNFVVNRDIFREIGETAVEYYNGDGRDELYGYYYDGFGGIDDSQREIITEDMLDDLEEVIESCSAMNTSDAAITLILVEEMPAYFSGQKDLDDVIKIMQDKIQTILNERK